MGNLLDLSNDLASAVERAAKSVVAIHARPRVPSSGVIWRPGVIVTTDHTTERDDDITVTLADGRTVAAKLAGRDPSTDLAVLRVAEAVDVADAADAAAVKPGHIVVAVGRGPTAALGFVSSAGGAWRTWRGGAIDRYLRVDVSIYHGYSGGALADGEGRVVGINTSGLTRGTPAVVTTATVNRVVDALVARGKVARGFLGVGMQPVKLPDSLKDRLSLTSTGGVIVLSVESASPAEKAGLLVGDVILAIDGKPAVDTDDVQASLGAESVGKALAVRVLRAGTLAEVAITVGERP